jgi:predicted alpha/beta-hydrolase family hydrolase
MTKKVSIPLGRQDQISAKISVPAHFNPGRDPGIILAHGAGNDMENPFLVFLAEGLARAGVLALRFNFPYKDAGRTAPDKPEVLEASWESTFDYLNHQPLYRPAFIVAAGKSMGGRIASQAATSGRLPVRGLVFYGYPLHPPGHPEKIRAAHLYSLSIPMFFFEGTRDPFCDLKLLEGVLEKIKSPWGLEIIDGGDHSFAVPKSKGLTIQTVYRKILDKTVEILQTGFFNKAGQA